MHSRPSGLAAYQKSEYRITNKIGLDMSQCDMTEYRIQFQVPGPECPPSSILRSLRHWLTCAFDFSVMTLFGRWRPSWWLDKEVKCQMSEKYANPHRICGAHAKMNLSDLSAPRKRLVDLLIITKDQNDEFTTSRMSQEPFGTVRNRSEPFLMYSGWAQND